MCRYYPSQQWNISTTNANKNISGNFRNAGKCKKAINCSIVRCLTARINRTIILSHCWLLGSEQKQGAKIVSRNIYGEWYMTDTVDQTMNIKIYHKVSNILLLNFWIPSQTICGTNTFKNFQFLQWKSVSFPGSF